MTDADDPIQECFSTDLLVDERAAPVPITIIKFQLTNGDSYGFPRNALRGWHLATGGDGHMLTIDFATKVVTVQGLYLEHIDNALSEGRGFILLEVGERYARLAKPDFPFPKNITVE